MSDEQKQEPPEENFVVTSSDVPEVQAETQPDAQEDGPKRGADGKFVAKEAEDDGAGPGAADADADPDGGTDSREEWSKLPLGVRKRIARANRQRDEERAENERLKAENARLRDTVKTVDPGPEDRLDPDDFDSYEDFENAVEARRRKRSETKKDAAPEAGGDDLHPDDKAFISASRADFAKAQADVKEAIDAHDPDLWKTMAKAEDLRIGAALIVSLSETSDPARLVEALVSEPAKAAKLSEMSPFAQARELARMEAGLGAPKTKTTDAPPPVDTVRTTGRPPPKDLKSMSQREYEDARAKEEQGAAGGGWI